MTWWQEHFPRVATQFGGELWSVSDNVRDRFGVNWIYGCVGGGLSEHVDYIHHGGNSGFQALHLAINFGASRVVLLGYDFMLGPQGERHWFGDHPPTLGNGGATKFARWCEDMGKLAQGATQRGIKILNASRRTSLKCFRRVTLETALHENRSPSGNGDG